MKVVFAEPVKAYRTLFRDIRDKKGTWFIFDDDLHRHGEPFCVTYNPTYCTFAALNYLGAESYEFHMPQIEGAHDLRVVTVYDAVLTLTKKEPK